MSALRIVKPLDVLEEIGTRRIARNIARLDVDALFLQARKEGFRHRIVPAVAPAAHAAADPVVSEEALEVLGRVLATLVGMMQQRLGLAAAPERHGQRIHHELRSHLRLHGPTHDPAKSTSR